MAKKDKVTCAWCGGLIAMPEVKVRRYNNGHGTVIERRCPKCDKVLAAYLEEEGDFLPKIRTF
jgi:phage FluMu protein Com